MGLYNWLHAKNYKSNKKDENKTAFMVRVEDMEAEQSTEGES